MRSPVPAFRFTGVIPLLWPRLSHSTPDTQFRVGSSLQAGLYARTPVQSDRCALSGNYHLDSNPDGHEKRHWQQPLVTRVYKMVFKEVLKWMPDCGYTERTVLVIAVLYTQLPRLENLPGSSIHRKSHRKVVFRFQKQRLRAEKMISRRSFLRRIDIHGIYDVPCNESITGMHLSAEEIPLRYKMIMISN